MADWIELAGRYCQLQRPQLPATGAQDPRIGHWLSGIDDPLDRPALALIGFPSEEGIARNGGRTGAAQGPAALRHWLYRMTPDSRHQGAMQALLEQVVDFGDLLVEDDLEIAQHRLGELVSACLDDDLLVIVLGGGHEVGYGHFLGYANAQCPVHIINVDAHADVRPLRDGLGHSGSPFRQALQHPSGMALGYSVLGLQPQSNSLEHIEFLRQQQAEYWFIEDTNDALIQSVYSRRDENIMATFCLDALDQAIAPGVSAPSPGGLSLQTWLSAIQAAAANPHTRSFDIAELSPPLDQDQRSARIAALSVWHILRGLALR